LAGKRKYGRSSQLIPWKNIRSYEVGKDLNRSLREVRFLKIWASHAPRIFVNDGDTAYSKEQFTRFTEELESKISQLNTADFPSNHTKRPVIKRKGGFYRSVFGKIIAVCLAVLAALIGTVMLSGGLGSGGSYFKLFAVLIPGAAYMLYRSFLKKD
jgi:hypothetical protein